MTHTTFGNGDANDRTGRPAGGPADNSRRERPKMRSHDGTVVRSSERVKWGNFGRFYAKMFHVKHRAEGPDILKVQNNPMH